MAFTAISTILEFPSPTVVIYAAAIVRRIGVFGSIARDEASSSSDLDFLVVFEKPTFDNYMDLKFRLEDHFQRKVDLVEPQTLKPRIKEAVTREAVYA